MSSGIWRVRVTKLEPVRRKTPFPDEPETGWGVFMEWTTTSKTPLKRTTASDGGPGATETGAVSWDLYFPSGASLGIFTYDESTALSKAGTGILGRGEDQTRLSDFFDRDFPPGVPRGGEVKFWYPAKNPAYRGKPTKLLIAGESYLSPYFAPIRFKLNCTHK